NLHQNIYIYPQLIPVHIPPFPMSLSWDVQGKQGGLLEDSLIVSGVRDYEPGDDWKRFNWWASARSGKMQTNVYQPVVSKQLLIYVDVEGFQIKQKYPNDEEKQHTYAQQQKSLFEDFLSVIASCIVAYDEQGVEIAYASNGRNYLGENQH